MYAEGKTGALYDGECRSRGCSVQQVSVLTLVEGELWHLVARPSGLCSCADIWDLGVFDLKQPNNRKIEIGNQKGCGLT